MIHIGVHQRTVEIESNGLVSHIEVISQDGNNRFPANR